MWDRKNSPGRMTFHLALGDRKKPGLQKTREKPTRQREEQMRSSWGSGKKTCGAGLGKKQEESKDTA